MACAFLCKFAQDRFFLCVKREITWEGQSHKKCSRDSFETTGNSPVHLIPLNIYNYTYPFADVNLDGGGKFPVFQA